MDLILALVIVLVAWLVFKSLTAVILALVACALAIWVVRNSRRL